MKSKYSLYVGMFILCSLFAPGILPKVGLSPLRADCATDPGNPSAFNSFAINASYLHNFICGTAYVAPAPGAKPVISAPTISNTGGGGGASSGSTGKTQPAPLAYTEMGNEMCAPTARKPALCDVTNGAFVDAFTDIKLPGVTPLAITRCYVSTIAYNGPMGYDFDFNYNRSLEFAAGIVYYHTGQGYKIQMNYTTFSEALGAIGGNSVGPVFLTMKRFSSVAGLLSLVPLCSGLSLDNGWVVADANGNSDVFDMSGRLQNSVDRNGNMLTYTRDEIGRLIKVEDPIHGTYLTFTLDVNGRITAVTDSTGRTVNYTYDTYYNLSEVTYPATADFPTGTTSKYTYDYDNRMNGIVDGNNDTIISNEYGGPGTPTEFDLTSQTIGGATATLSYGTYAITYTDNNGFITDYYNDGNGNINKKNVHTAGLHSGEPSTYETDWTYDSNSRLTEVRYPKGNSTQWTYDGYGDALVITQSTPDATTPFYYMPLFAWGVPPVLESIDSTKEITISHCHYKIFIRAALSSGGNGHRSER